MRSFWNAGWDWKSDECLPKKNERDFQQICRVNEISGFVVAKNCDVFMCFDGEKIERNLRYCGLFSCDLSYSVKTVLCTYTVRGSQCDIFLFSTQKLKMFFPPIHHGKFVSASIILISFQRFHSNVSFHSFYHLFRKKFLLISNEISPIHQKNIIHPWNKNSLLHQKKRTKNFRIRFLFLSSLFGQQTE